MKKNKVSRFRLTTTKQKQLADSLEVLNVLKFLRTSTKFLI